MKVDYPAFLTKTAVLVLILALLPFPYSILLGLFVTWGYQYLVAFAYGAIVMPTMDTVLFIGDDDVRINFISFTIIEKSEFNLIKDRIKVFMKEKPKLRWRITKIFGDYYWQDTSVEESIDYVF